MIADQIDINERKMQHREACASIQPSRSILEHWFPLDAKAGQSLKGDKAGKSKNERERIADTRYGSENQTKKMSYLAKHTK